MPITDHINFTHPNKRQPWARGAKMPKSKITTLSYGAGKTAVRLAGLAAALFIGGCGSSDYKGELSDVDSYYGAISGDEPRAVLVGRNLMASGGNAADAIVGAYFAMSVTLPSSAGLGGGGVCVIHRAGDEDERADEVLEFLPNGAKGGLVAIPGNVRGMAALSARYGKLPWAQLVSPAESLANQGNAVSRALANDLRQAEHKIKADSAMAALFIAANGEPLGEGDNLAQPELGSLLAQIRAKGPGGLYGGLAGQQLVAAAQSIGAPLAIEDLREFVPQFVKPLTIKLGDQTVHLPPPPVYGGISVAQMILALDKGRADDPVFMADTSLRLAADRRQWMNAMADPMGADRLVTEDYVDGIMQSSRPSNLSKQPENPFFASLVAADRDGLAIACNYSMNALFGSGHLAPGIGIILAPAPDERGFGYSAMAPLIMSNEYNGEFYFASSAGGGLAGAFAEASVLQDIDKEDLALEAALLRPRVFNDGDPDIVYYDKTGDRDPGPALKSAGMETSEEGIPSRVNAIYCLRGAPSAPETCQVRADYRGNGLAAVVTKN